MGGERGGVSGLWGEKSIFILIFFFIEKRWLCDTAAEMRPQ